VAGLRDYCPGGGDDLLWGVFLQAVVRPNLDQRIKGLPDYFILKSSNQAHHGSDKWRANCLNLD